jgi:hypothetical protein
VTMRFSLHKRPTHDCSRKVHLKNALLAVALMLSSGMRVSAHTGPPYTIVVDKNIGPCVVSVWADPDVGTGIFFIILDPLPGATLPDDIKVEVGVQPVSGRLPEARYVAWRDRVRGHVQYKVEVPFDAQELWRVRVLVQSSLGNGETTTDVEVTPPGMGRWDLLLYLFPFVAVGVIWLRAVLKGRSRKKAPSH